MAENPKKPQKRRATKRRIRLGGKTWECHHRKNRVACRVAPKAKCRLGTRCPKGSDRAGTALPADAKKWTAAQRRTFCTTMKPEHAPEWERHAGGGMDGLGRARRRRSKKKGR